VPRRLVPITAIVVLAASCSSLLGESSTTTTTTTTLPPTTQPTTTTVPVPIDAPPAAVLVTPGDDLAAFVDDAEPGTEFLLAAGLHRGSRITPKDGMVFSGQTGAILSGALPLDGFTFDGTHWRLAVTVKSDEDRGSCIDEAPACGLPQDLFMDDVMLRQVVTVDRVEPGTWAWDGSSVVVADDPTSRRVELSVTEHAFLGDADDVAIRDLVIEKYATPAQLGAVQAQVPGDGERGSGWTIEGVEIRFNHGAGLRTGDGTVVRNSFIHHNGQLGVAVSGGTDVLLEDTEIAWNNTAGFSWGWEAGGMKATRTLRLVVRGVYSHDNHGPGLWTDIDARDTLYEDNVVADNFGPGIYHEISYDAVIRGNQVFSNGLGSRDWLFGAGILVAGSSNVEVHDNEVVDNGDGIAAIQQDRGAGDYGPHVVENLWVHDNTISMSEGHTGVVQDVGNNAVFERNNRFDRNTYVDVRGQMYAWMNDATDRRGWLAAGQDPNGTWE